MFSSALSDEIERHSPGLIISCRDVAQELWRGEGKKKEGGLLLLFLASQVSGSLEMSETVEEEEEDVHDVLGGIAIAIVSCQAPSYTLSDNAGHYLVPRFSAFSLVPIVLRCAHTTGLACHELVHKNNTISLR